MAESENLHLLETGRGTYFDRNINIMSWTNDAKVRIGRYCSIARDCTFILKANHRPDWVTTSTMLRGPVTPELDEHLNHTLGHNAGDDITIGNDVWIGTQAMILPGVKIGDGAVITARSVVTRDVKPYSVVGGFPAQVLYYRFPAEIIEKLLQIKWWEWSAAKVAEYSDVLWSNSIEAFIEKATAEMDSIKKFDIVAVENGNRRVHFTNVTSTTKQVEVRFIEPYTGITQYIYPLDIPPDATYWSEQPLPWKNRKFAIFDRETQEVYNSIILDGDFELEPMDREGYLKKIAERESRHERRLGLIDVVAEHLATHEMSDYVDVEPGDVVVDVGFNFGIFSLRALNKGASRIVAFEPDKELYEKIHDIYPDKDKVTLHNVAVSDHYGETTFYSTLGSLDSSTLCKPVNTMGLQEYAVPCIEFYDFIRNTAKLDHIDLLKIDCEGEEYRIMENIPDEFLSTIPKLILEYHFNNGPEVKPILDKLVRCGFDYVKTNPDWISGDRNTDSIGMIYAKRRKPADPVE